MKNSANCFLFHLGTVFVITLTLGVSSISKADIIAQESFNYPVGTNLTGCNGGSGWGSEWRSSGNADVYPRVSTQAHLPTTPIVTLGGTISPKPARHNYLNKISHAPEFLEFTRDFSQTAQTEIKTFSKEGKGVWFRYLAKGSSRVSLSMNGCNSSKDLFTIRKYSAKGYSTWSKEKQPETYPTGYALKVIGEKSELSDPRAFPGDEMIVGRLRRGENMFDISLWASRGASFGALSSWDKIPPSMLYSKGVLPPNFENTSLTLSCSLAPDAYVGDFIFEDVAANPEPCTVVVLGVGSMLLLRKRRKIRKS